MKKYLLTSEEELINSLINNLSETIPLKENNPIKNEFINIIKNTKDYNVEEIINYYLNSLINKLIPLLEENITPALQFGIKTNNFQVSAYGGKYNESKDITKDTYFSFDSISKLITSTITIEETRNKNFTLKKTINQINKDYNLDTTIDSILKFTARIKTEKRIENLSIEETINILKKCKENIKEKEKHKNFYEYNDIGYMILRQTINNFIEKLDILLSKIDNKNLTYNYLDNKNNITGGKKGEEYITQDKKGREILFPGHTGLYGNITGLLNLFYQIAFTDNILTKNEKKILFKQPYKDPTMYKLDKTPKTGINNQIHYISRVSGVYITPKGIDYKNFDKLYCCDMSNYTTKNSMASAGTCGSWVTGDNLYNKNKFGIYTCGILTNPYSYIEKDYYPSEITNIPNTSLKINHKGKIIAYQTKLNKYKEIITEYSIILELILEYINEIDKNSLNKANKIYTKKII